MGFGRLLVSGAVPSPCLAGFDSSPIKPWVYVSVPLILRLEIVCGYLDIKMNPKVPPKFPSNQSFSSYIE